jgi:DNA-binding SARP family transcriptional activator
MEFGVLGTLLVRSHSADIPIAGAKLRALLAGLLLQANRTVSQESLAEVVWDGHPPPEALGTLRSYVMRLRRTLGAEAGDRIVTRPSGYAIEVQDDEFDLRRFQNARNRARDHAAAGDWSAVSATLTDALALWRGEPLADVRVHEALRDDIATLVEERLQATHQRIAADLELGRHEAVLAELRELTARHPLHELFRGQFMLALYRSGRQAEALAVYRAARRLLIEELGVEPTPQLQTLHERILAADPALAAPEPGERASASASERAGPHRPGPDHVVPRQLPRGIEHFTGRTDELATLTNLMSGEGRTPGTVVISAVAGTGGVGKTALALHWAHQFADRYPDGQLYTNLQGFDPRRAPLAPDQAVRGFLDALGVAPSRVPVGLDAQAAHYRSLVAERRILILLDNAADAEQVRPLLPGGPDCMVLITSRNRLTSLVAAEGARPVPLDILSTAEARELLTVRLGAEAVAAEQAAADELIDLCARLPLALNIAASLAAFQPQAPLRDLADRLREQQARLDTLNAGDPATDMRAVFACSYQALSPDAASLFRRLGLHSGADFTVEVAAALTALPVPAVRRLLTELTASTLVAEHDSERFALHDLLRAYALEQCEAEEPTDERHAAIERMLCWYLGMVGAVARTIDPFFPLVDFPERPGTPEPARFADIAEALAWVEIERHNLSASVTHAAAHGDDEHAWKLAVTLQHYYNRACRWDDWLTTHEAALEAAKRLGDRGARGLLLQSIGWLYTRTRRVDQGMECLEESAALLSAVGDRYGLAMTTSYHGNAHMMIGEWEQAVERFRDVIEVDRQIGYRRGEGIAVSNLSVCLQFLKRWDEADEQARLADGINLETAQLSSRAVALLTRKNVAVWRGDLPAAFAFVDEALEVRRQIGDRFGEACVLEERARVYIAADDLPAAIATLNQSAAIFDQVDPPWAASQREWIARLRAGAHGDGALPS